MRLTCSPFFLGLSAASSSLRTALYLSFFCDLRSMATARSLFTLVFAGDFFIGSVCQFKNSYCVRNVFVQ